MAPSAQNLLSLSQAALERPDALALIAGDQSFSYQELWERVRPIAIYLSEISDGKSVIALEGINSLETVLVVLALIEIEQTFALLQPGEPSERREALLRILQTSFYIEDSAQFCRDSEGGLEPGEWSKKANKTLAILFTSGRREAFSAVSLSRAAFVASAKATAEILALQEGDRWLLSLSLAHIGGLSILTRCLIARTTVILSAAKPFVPQSFLETVAAKRATIVSVVPTMLQRLLEQKITHRDIASVRALIVGGAPLSLQAQHVALAQGLPLYVTYGMTETCSQITLKKLVSAGSDVGRPLRDVDVRIVDGSIEIRGPILFEEYITGGAAIEKKSDWYRTNDCGFLDEQQCLHVTGRSDRVIISGGKKINPEVIEACLLENPALHEVCVVSLPDEEWGEVVVAVLEKSRDQVTEQTLRDHCKGRLAPHETPKRFVWLDQLLRTASGKIDYRAVEEQLKFSV